MGFLSSKSSASNTTTTTTTQTDNRVSTANYGDGLTVGGNNNRTIVTDGGAIAGAFDLSSEAMEQMNEAMSHTYGFAEDFADKVLEAGYYSQKKAGDVLTVASNMANQAFDQVDQMSRSETANEIQTLGRYGAMLLGLTVAGLVIIKIKG